MNWYYSMMKAAMSPKFVDTVLEGFENRETLPFQHMFPDEHTHRMVTPFISPEEQEIINDLQAKGYTVNAAEGTASKPYTDQRGKTRPRVQRLGKTIRLELGEQVERQWSDATNGGGMAMLISRHPVDILRMSDFKNIQSCHSQGGDYFKCAIAEAVEGGAIAYLVQQAALQGVDLDADEIFKDEKRGIGGLVPQSRIRLRRFVRKDGAYDLAIPEDRVYGNKVSGFSEGLRDWAYDKQQNVLHGERPNLKDFYRTGGSYEDTSAHELFNSFFEDEQDRYQKVELRGTQEGKELADQWEEEIENFDSAVKIQHGYANASVTRPEEYGGDTDAPPYLSAYGGIQIPIPQNFWVNFDQIGYQRRREIREEISEFINDLSIESIEFENEGIHIAFSGEYVNNPDDYEQFRKDIAGLDDEIPAITANIIRLLEDMGHLQVPQNRRMYSDIQKDGFDNYGLQHFQVNAEEGFIDIKSPMIPLKMPQNLWQVAKPMDGETEVEPWSLLAQKKQWINALPWSEWQQVAENSLKQVATKVLADRSAKELAQYKLFPHEEEPQRPIRPAQASVEIYFDNPNKYRTDHFLQFYIQIRLPAYGENHEQNAAIETAKILDGRFAELVSKLSYYFNSQMETSLANHMNPHPSMPYEQQQQQATPQQPQQPAAPAPQPHMPPVQQPVPAAQPPQPAVNAHVWYTRKPKTACRTCRRG